MIASVPMDRAYLDHNATAPLRPEAREAMVEALGVFGNPSSVHAEGRAARSLVERARQAVGDMIGAAAERVTFTSGGSESNATALTPHWRTEGGAIVFDRLFVGASEHPSVLAGGRFPAESVTPLPVDGEGVLDLDALEEGLRAREGPSLVSVMAANNETGVLQPVAEIARIVHAHGGLFHCDAVQVPGRIPFALDDAGADVVSLSAHKIGGPKGIGALVRAPEAPRWTPLIGGGGQESRLRAGTEDVAAIAGFGAAAAATRFDPGRATLWRGLIARAERVVGNGAVVYGAGVDRLPQTLCFAISGVSAETMVIALDLAGVAVSSGSACSSGKVGPSHVLAAMGVAENDASSAVRISLGWDSQESDLDLFASAWRNVIKHVAT